MTLGKDGYQSVKRDSFATVVRVLTFILGAGVVIFAVCYALATMQGCGGGRSGNAPIYDGGVCTKNCNGSGDTGTAEYIGNDDIKQPICQGSCDDEVACTIDSCNKSTGECLHQADHSLCDPGSVCMPKEGCQSPPPCATDKDCPDTDNSPCMQEYCDPSSSACHWKPLDKDGDGHAPQICTDTGGDDCDDDDSLRYPGKTEECNKVDDDCNGIVDDIQPGTEEKFYRDYDEDGFGNPEEMKEACFQPEGYVNNSGDCDDTDANVTNICWFDTGSGLTWQNLQSEDQLPMTWQKAVDYCENLTLANHSDWHLPTISELRSLIRGCPATELGGICGVTDDCLSWDASCWDECLGCSSYQGPSGYGGSDGYTDGCYWPNEMVGECKAFYWSSSSLEDDISSAWDVLFNEGFVTNHDKKNSQQYEYLWLGRCVYGGQ